MFETKKLENYYVDEKLYYYQSRQKNKFDDYFINANDVFINVIIERIYVSIINFQCRYCHVIVLFENELYKYFNTIMPVLGNLHRMNIDYISVGNRMCSD